jgi:hypothetical protein
MWSLLTQDDLTLTRALPKDIPRVLDHIKKEFRGMRACVLLWQHLDDQNIHVCIAADTRLLKLLSEKTQGEFNDTHGELADTYDSFPDAERATLALLDAIL